MFPGNKIITSKQVSDHFSFYFEDRSKDPRVQKNPSNGHIEGATVFRAEIFQQHRCHFYPRTSLDDREGKRETSDFQGTNASINQSLHHVGQFSEVRCKSKHWDITCYTERTFSSSLKQQMTERVLRGSDWAGLRWGPDTCIFVSTWVIRMHMIEVDHMLRNTCASC